MNDTELVAKSTVEKIDKEVMKELSAWKHEMYQGLISKINSFVLENAPPSITVLSAKKLCSNIHDLFIESAK